MDPVACFNELHDLVVCGEFTEASERLLDLREWLERGGFIPEEITHRAWASLLAKALAQLPV